MPVISHCPATHVFPALQLIRDAAAVIESGQGGSKEVKIIVASLETIRAAVEWNAGVRARDRHVRERTSARRSGGTSRSVSITAAPPASCCSTWDRFGRARQLGDAGRSRAAKVVAQ